MGKLVLVFLFSVGVYRINVRTFPRVVLSLLLASTILLLIFAWLRHGVWTLPLVLLGSYLAIYYLELTHHKWQRYLILLGYCVLNSLLV